MWIEAIGQECRAARSCTAASRAESHPIRLTRSVFARVVAFQQPHDGAAVHNPDTIGPGWLVWLRPETR